MKLELTSIRGIDGAFVRCFTNGAVVHCCTRWILSATHRQPYLFRGAEYMPIHAKCHFCWLLFTFLLSPYSATIADEGMWLFNDLPKEQLAQRYGFEPTDEWAEHVRLSSVRFNSGGSASFVSSDGLVITNHHVAADTLYKISTKEDNYFDDGFLAKSMADEIRAPDLELNQLVAIDDVTDIINAAVTDKMSTAEAFKARRAVMAEVEAASLKETGYRSDVVTLFGGAKYHLYRYKKFTDVRVVFAPESAIAFFGGDADNFEYPRYCLDICIFRVYEDGKPAKIEHFLKWSKNGAGEGELVFVSGNPGRTQRIFTTDALRYLRDHRLPLILDRRRRSEVMLQQYSLGSPEAERQARDGLFGIQNSRKAYMGMLAGLQNPAFLKSRTDLEAELLAKMSPSQRKPWDDVKAVLSEKQKMLGEISTFRSRLYDVAETLVLMSSEDQKPSAERLREFRDSARESLEQDLFSPAPIYPNLEVAQLADQLALLVEQRGGDDPLALEVLGGMGPRERAAQLVLGTKLMDIDVRKKWAESDSAAIAESSDPMIQLARIMEPQLRRVRDKRDELQEMERQAYAAITEIKNELLGTSGYPDATFTLRLAFGPVTGYMLEGKPVAAWTTMAGAFEHQDNHGGEEPWQLPESWVDARGKLRGETPFNFVCTADIIGGNSGSPVINREGEFVGIIFDGNIQSLTADYFYSDQVARAVSVHSSAIREALEHVYDARHIADRLGK